MRYEEDGTPRVLKGVMENYMQSKTGAVWLSLEFARRLGGDGVLSVVSSLSVFGAWFLEVWFRWDHKADGE